MESIERFVIEQLASWEVPGCAIAAVQDGQTVLTAGWGQRDLDTGVPVTSDTLFAIGSVTKAFTAATVGALVDDGLLEWERPLRDCLPELRLYDPDGDITALTVPLEPLLEPLRFDRLPDARAQDPEVLQRPAAPTPWAQSRSWSPCGVTRC